MDIRVARADELGEIAQFYHDIWHETQAPFQPEDVARFRDVQFMRDRIDLFFPNIIIATDKGVIRGIVVAQNARISQLFVGPQTRGKGVGEKLLSLGEAKLLAEGASKISLTCLTENVGAKRFYERHNWKAARRIDKPVQTHNGNVLVSVFEMVKSL